MDVILGTAGHIDHGKTSLVRALTGIDCDRLEEEKNRGITIELGFAWLDLPNGRRVGIVDVPGHERFVKNMVAGASGIDCVLLVIAADEGVMPQTREHLEICSLLGVRSGLVALNKVDLVDADWLKMAQEDIETALAGTFLENAPIVPVSAATGAGLEQLRAGIISQIAAARPAPRTDIFRLPVDRVFSMKGFGTVVTGTVVSGTCGQGEKLCLVPSGKLARARALQVHNNQVETAGEGQRCAINLQGLEVADIARGDIVARPNTLFPSKRWLIKLNCLASSPLPIRQRMEVHFHHGSRECMAKIILKDCDALEPGQTGLAEVRFGSPLAAVYGDHCVLRAHSPLRAIGGGIVINPMPPVLQKRKADYAHKFALVRELGASVKNDPAQLSPKSPEALVKICLELYPAPGLDIRQLQVLTALPAERLANALAILEKKGEAFCWDKSGGYWIGRDVLQNCLDQCRIRGEELHKREPLKSCFAHTALISGWGEELPEKFAQELLSFAVSQGIFEPAGPGLKLASHKIRLDAASIQMLEILRRKFKAGAAMPPFVKEILEESGWDIKKAQPLLDYLSDSGEAVKIQDGVYYNKQELEKIIAKIQGWFATHETLEMADVKPLLGISRKYTIPLLEYLDSIRLTYRAGNSRRWRK